MLELDFCQSDVIRLYQQMGLDFMIEEIQFKDTIVLTDFGRLEV